MSSTGNGEAAEPSKFRPGKKTQDELRRKSQSAVQKLKQGWHETGAEAHGKAQFEEF